MALTEANIDVLRTKYTEKWQEEFQQRVSRFRSVAEYIPGVTGERYEWPLIGSMFMREYNDYYHKVVDDEPSVGRRSIRKRKGYTSTKISDDIARDMAPLDWHLGLLQREQMAAMERWFDEVFLGVEAVRDSNNKPTGEYQIKQSMDDTGGYCGGLLGPNYVGAGGLNTASLDLSYTDGVAGKNLIPVDYTLVGTGVASALSGTILEKLIYVKRKLEEQEVFMGGESASVCMAISPAVKQLLCSYEVSINHDYGFSQLAENGAISLNKFLNVNFIVTNMLPKMDTTTADGKDITGARMCVSWLKNRVGVAPWMDTQVDIRQLADYVDCKYRQIVKCHLGASRKDDDTTYVIPVQETA